MDIVLYLILGFIDVMAILTVTFRLFRFPIRMFLKDIITIGVALSCTSFVMRLLLNVPELDLGIQFILYILFFRYLIKIKIFDSLLFASIGCLFVIVVQIIFYHFFLFISIVIPADMQSTSNLGTYLIQITSQITCFLLAWCFYRFNLGFSFVMCPPQDVHLKVKVKGINILILFGIGVSIATLFLAPYLLIYYLNWLHVAAFVMTTLLCLLYYATNKRDVADIW
ncbi:hypothetical protein ABE354_23595 [Brevibacillus laterosporus]|uniref:hypothetical protein n=1 Tax=Brevibacillus laterosporus TaxID=1465 RepID=UPI003D1B80FE